MAGPKPLSLHSRHLQLSTASYTSQSHRVAPDIVCWQPRIASATHCR